MMIASGCIPPAPQVMISMLMPRSLLLAMKSVISLCPQRRPFGLLPISFAGRRMRHPSSAFQSVVVSKKRGDHEVPSASLGPSFQSTFTSVVGLVVSTVGSGVSSSDSGLRMRSKSFFNIEKTLFLNKISSALRCFLIS